MQVVLSEVKILTELKIKAHFKQLETLIDEMWSLQ